LHVSWIFSLCCLIPYRKASTSCPLIKCSESLQAGPSQTHCTSWSPSHYIMGNNPSLCIRKPDLHPSSGTATSRTVDADSFLRGWKFAIAEIKCCLFAILRRLTLEDTGDRPTIERFGGLVAPPLSYFPSERQLGLKLTIYLGLAWCGLK
jgi:hypothetical protein